MTDWLADEDVVDDPDEDPIPKKTQDPKETLHSALQQWMHAKTLHQRTEAVGLLTVDALKVLAPVAAEAPPNFIKDIKDLTDNPVQEMAQRMLRTPGREKVLTLTMPQAFKLLVKQRVEPNNMDEHNGKLLVMMPGFTGTFVLDFKERRATYYMRDGDDYVNTKTYKLTNAFIFDLAAAWVKRKHG